MKYKLTVKECEEMVKKGLEFMIVNSTYNTKRKMGGKNNASKNIS